MWGKQQATTTDAPAELIFETLRGARKGSRTIQRFKEHSVIRCPWPKLRTRPLFHPLLQPATVLHKAGLAWDCNISAIPIHASNPLHRLPRLSIAIPHEFTWVYNRSQVFSTSLSKCRPNLPGVLRCRLRRFGLNLQLVHLARAVLLQLYWMSLSEKASTPHAALCHCKLCASVL